MKVLSILQPWASLIVMGPKRIETRSWATKYRGPLLIHASTGKKREGRELLEDPRWCNPCDEGFYDLPFGAIIGQVNLVDVIPTSHIIFNMGREKAAGIAAPYEEAFGDYSPGRYGWLLSDPVVFDKPIPAKGKLGLWDHKGDILLR